MVIEEELEIRWLDSIDRTHSANFGQNNAKFLYFHMPKNAL
jgi:hypothetical protein